MEELTDVLRGGRQCDEEGVEIVMSRQACLEAADEIERLQCKIDELMLEHCPEEMTPEQMAEYERHQVSVPNHGFTPMRKHLDWMIKEDGRMNNYLTEEEAGVND